ncbi:toll/interleukin-1 receptor domain-containing protein [Thermodesulfobacteriota bacterium]
MANLKHMDIIKRGVDYWNTWRINNSHILPSLSEAGLHMAYLNKANLSRADLSDAGLRLAELIQANLQDADLNWANLSEANLRGANIREANLQGANMTGSNLRGTKLNLANLSRANISRADISCSELNRANLFGADLSGADLSNSVLKGANLIGANLTGADLDGADLTNAVIGGTIFGNVDLRNVKGLESLQHLGPSTVGIDTIYKSNGTIPVQFLRNAGVPGHLIDYIQMFVDRNKKHYSCLISYSVKNKQFAHKLYEDLQAHGVRCWLVNEKLKRRDKNHTMMNAAVNQHDKLILILSEDSVDEVWVENEYNQAVEKEMRIGKTTLVPIILDDSIEVAEQPWAVKMRRTRYAADFSSWRDSDAYQKVLGYLLEELTMEEEFSNCLDEFHREELNVPDDFPEAFERVNYKDMTEDFRAERREFC